MTDLSHIYALPAPKHYICKSCGVEYGTRGAKKEYTCCPGCWREYLAVHQTNIRKQFVERMKTTGGENWWVFLTDKPEPESV